MTVHGDARFRGPSEFVLHSARSITGETEVSPHPPTAVHTGNSQCLEFRAHRAEWRWGTRAGEHKETLPWVLKLTFLAVDCFHKSHLSASGILPLHKMMAELQGALLRYYT